MYTIISNPENKNEFIVCFAANFKNEWSFSELLPYVLLNELDSNFRGSTIGKCERYGTIDLD